MSKQKLDAITNRIIERSRDSRAAYEAKIQAMRDHGRARPQLSCGNLAHAYAACGANEKDKLVEDTVPNIGIVSAYNDMLSAHQPYHAMLDAVKQAVTDAGGVAQMAGGVPAMCDGVTQGQPGMELSLLSREVIAMATAVAMSHNVFEGGMLLGVCDKIVPGLLMGALSFGHLPFTFVPAGPMPTGISNSEKAKVREQYELGEVSRKELLESESRAYHSPGTCTFYGTANSNQMMLEMMGLQLPGSSFVNPGDPLRPRLTYAAGQAMVSLARLDAPYGLAEMVDAKSLVNGMAGLLATGGSTNHTMHIVAIARAAGINITWQDFSDLSDFVPLLARVYPNGTADVNAFHQAGGTPFVTRELLSGGCLHEDINTILGPGATLAEFTKTPSGAGEAFGWHVSAEESGDDMILRKGNVPFQPTGGLKVLHGNLGEAVIKVSAVKEENRIIEAPAIVLDDQNDLLPMFRAGELDKDFVAVIRFQGPRANGMPELHKLTPSLSILQDRGYKVALVTDGRMSGASGKVPAAIHVTPEALDGGILTKIRTGDKVRLDSVAGTLDLLVDAAELAARESATQPTVPHTVGRDLFTTMRPLMGTAATGASLFTYS